MEQQGGMAALDPLELRAQVVRLELLELLVEQEPLAHKVLWVTQAQLEPKAELAQLVCKDLRATLDPLVEMVAQDPLVHLDLLDALAQQEILVSMAELVPLDPLVLRVPRV